MFTLSYQLSAPDATWSLQPFLLIFYLSLVIMPYDLISLHLCPPASDFMTISLSIFFFLNKTNCSHLLCFDEVGNKFSFGTKKSLL